ncbi:MULTISPECIES: UDP-N-acetylmuramate dehydrogenase [unclassified Psychrobacter]|uniref:UDP-N-acetylmuramate dehydrogenase n=1 Tax=unclassified Psychrobacter TaxID=196806 RepID=UPI0025B2F2A9|nr:MULTISPECIES: UDP-N-acetylmuramate dehydrogenase [unclassified Psychrobacter]MDN3454018.1 UDP-N-acetylmuramate dehydrogenase [Psychrobacter sp. APC 3350]MDN3503268.1 UDP-N-acetylmuramate dehydrogenase [Psychrobacter sp. 5A.1]
MALACVADAVVTLTAEAQLDAFMAAYVEDTTDKLPLFVLSGGSNVLLPAALKALVLQPKMCGIHLTARADDWVDIEVMAGENWHDLVVHTVNQGWYGLENLALIPGLTGAAPVQNIGAYGVQLEDCLQYVRAYHLPTQTWHHLTAADCQFGYRDSIFKRTPNTWLISRVGFRLHTDPTNILASYGDVQTVAQRYAEQQGRKQATPVDVMQAIIEIRQQKLPDPKQLPNCGSFFQNPIIGQDQFTALQATYPTIVGYNMPDAMIKVAAGWLIEQAGLKGDGVAPIFTHKQQALVLTNHTPQQATQKEVAVAQQYIADTVYEKFSIQLSREPVWVNADGSIGYAEHVV